MCPSNANILLEATYIPDILLFKFKQKTVFGVHENCTLGQIYKNYFTFGFNR